MDTIEIQIEKLQKGIENPFVSQPMKEKMKEALKQLEMRNINVAVPAQNPETTVLDLENRLKILNLMVKKNPKVKPRIKIVKMMLKKAKEAEKTSPKTKKTPQKSGKVKVKDIEIVWSEGDQSKFDKFPKKYKTWKDANDAIKPIALDNKGYQGYNKVKFIVTFENGETYEGRLDVTYDRYDSPFNTDNVVGQHIKEFLNYELDGEHSQATDETKKEIEEWLDKYDLGLPELKRVNKVSAKELVAKMVNLVKGKVDPDYAHKAKYITEQDVEKFMSYGVYDELIIAFYCGVEIGFNWEGDLDYGGVQGIFVYTEDYIQDSIDRALKNCRAGKFELGFKYPHFDWSKILKGKPEEQIIEGKEREIPSTKQKYISVFKILKYPNIVVGGDIGVREDMGGGIAWEDKTNPNQNVLESTYLGMVSSNPKAILDVLKACAKQKDGGAKDMDVLVNGLGGIGYRELDINKIKYEEGGEISDRMYNFLKEDLKELETAINNRDTEKTEQLFSYWNQHLPSLQTKTNDRMYNFLTDDFTELEEAVSKGDNEEIERFFSYWNHHLKSLKMANGGQVEQIEDGSKTMYLKKDYGYRGGYGDKVIVSAIDKKLGIYFGKPEDQSKLKNYQKSQTFEYEIDDLVTIPPNPSKMSDGGQIKELDSFSWNNPTNPSIILAEQIGSDGKKFYPIYHTNKDRTKFNWLGQGWTEQEGREIFENEKSKYSQTFSSGGESEKKYIVTDGKDFGIIINAKNVDEALRIGNREFWSPYPVQVKLTQVQPYEKGKHSFVRASGNTNFDKVQFHFSGDGAGKVTQYNTNIDVEPTDSQKDFIGNSKVDFVKFYNKTKYTQFADGGQTFKGYGVEIRRDKDSYWEQYAENLSKEEADKLAADLKSSGKYHEVVSQVPLPFAEGGETIPTYGSWVERHADGDYRVSVKRKGMDLRHIFNDVFKPSELVRAEKFAKKIAENHKVPYRGIDTTTYDFVKTGGLSSDKNHTWEVVRGADDSIVISDGHDRRKWDFAGNKVTPPTTIEFEQLKSVLTYDTIEAPSFQEAYEKAKKKYSNTFAKGGETDDKWMQEAEKEMEKDGTVGLFTKKADKAGKTTVEFAKEVLDPKNKDKYDLKTRREAQFMKNANPELFKDGGQLSPTEELDIITSDEFIIKNYFNGNEEAYREYKKREALKNQDLPFELGGEVREVENRLIYQYDDNRYETIGFINNSTKDLNISPFASKELQEKGEEWAKKNGFKARRTYANGGEVVKSKFKEGDKVYYLPKLSGFKNSKPLIIEYAYYKTEDDLSKSLGVDYEPTWVYGFKDSHLQSEEKDLSLDKPKYEEGGELEYSLEKYFNDYDSKTQGNPYGKSGGIYYVVIEDENNPSNTIKRKVWAEGEEALRHDINHYLSDSQYIEELNFIEGGVWNEKYEVGGETKKKNKRFGVFLAGNMIGEVAYAEDVHDLISNRMLKRWNNWETIKYKDDDGKTVVVTRYFMDDDGMSVQEVIDDYYQNATSEDFEDEIAVLDPKNRQVYGKPKEVKGWLLHEQGGELTLN